MKKISLLALLCAFFSAASSYAKDGFYVGADLLFANSNHQYQDNSSTGGSNNYNNTTTHDNSLGFAFNAGYKNNFERLFLAPEIFFDQLNNSSPGFRYKEVPNEKQNRIDLNYRYGVKLNLGYDITPKFNIFANLGFANVDYDTRGSYAGGRKPAKTKLEQVYGFGVGYQITDRITARLTYDRQAMKLRNTQVLDNANYKSSLDVIKLGAVYSF